MARAGEVVVGYLPLSQEDNATDTIWVQPCEGCPFSGAVTDVSPDSAVVEHISRPYGTRYTDVMLHFEQPAQPELRTGLIGVRLEGDEAGGQDAAREVTEALRRCVDSQRGPLTGRDSSLLRGLLLRKTVTVCGAYHELRKTPGGQPVIELRPVLAITDAPQ